MALDSFKTIFDELKNVRTYLIKKGRQRTENIIVKKLEEANKLQEKFNLLIKETSEVLFQIKDERTLNEIHTYCNDFEKVYAEILSLCKQEQSSRKMEFDLKVALSLLPVMTDEVVNTKTLIDGIEYYNTILNPASKKQLINFILKTRLSQSAKLKLAQNYGDVTELLQDMKNCLLPKKSTTSLQKQLLSLKQNDMSIDEFGKKLSEMFVELTITQSDNNSESYSVLKPLNERQAIKQFAEGLRNRRLSTIVSARDYDSLQNAIQGAIDEDVSSNQSQSGELFSMRRGYNTNRNYRGRRPSYYPRGQNGPPGTYYNRGNYRGGYNSQYVSSASRGRPASSWARVRSQPFRGNYAGNSSQPFYNRTQPAQMHVLEQEQNSEVTTTQTENQFFRE